MRLDELRRLNKLLGDATGPADVFMALRDRSLRGDSRALAVANELRRLQSLANPERFMGNPPAQDLAREIQSRLLELHRAAVAVLDADASVDARADAPREPVDAAPPDADVAGASREPPAAWDRAQDVASHAATPAAPGFVVIAGPSRYEVDPRLTAGDVAAIHRGRCVEGPRAGTEVVAKVALDRADNGLILAEVDALRLLHRADGAQRRQLPAVLDLFQGGEGNAGVVLAWSEGLDGAALRARFPAGIPPEHVIWIGRRLLSVAGFAHRHGVVHANIEPAHAIVRAHDHHVALIDWCWSVIEPARTHQGFRVFNPDFSAPEVAEKKPPLPAADLYSIGRCMLFLMGGDLATGAVPEAVPDRLQRFVRYLTRPSPLQRAQDAWEMFAELERVRAAVYGAHSFQEFVVPDA